MLGGTIWKAVEMAMEPLTIDDMKAIQLEIMDELDRICHQQGIQYFIGYGSLLGAVRHGGFIPWDDDMDVVLMRSEYERLIEGFDGWRASDRFALASYRDGKSIYPFVKMVDTTTRVLENFVDKGTATGVWVDLFPLDDVNPTDLRPFRRNARLSLTRSFIVADASVGTNSLVKLAKRLVCPFAHRLDALEYARAIDENAKTACPGGSDRVADIIGEGKTSLIFPKSLFEDAVDMEFEDRTFPAPSGWEEFLRIQYGGWRTPPPEEDRLIHTFEAYRL